jgi:putative DNA-binding protein
MLPERVPCRRTHVMPSYAAVFSDAVTRPDRETPSVVTGAIEKSTVRRFNIYRNNVTVSLIETLAAIFSAVKRITGEEFFRAMARSHIRQTLPRSPLLFEYGRDFPCFIAGYEYARDMPWLPDVARIERAWLDAYHAADAEPLSPFRLSSVPPAELPELLFTPHPATRIVRSRYSAVTIFAANRGTEQFGQIDAGVAEDALITRPELDVVVSRLPPGGAMFFSALICGSSLAQAATAALGTANAFDIAAAVAIMIEAGAFTAFNSGDAS